jgi:hypothetical protein
MKQFTKWNTLKETLHSSKKENFFKERDVFWASIGVNIGYEQERLENKVGKINQENFNNLKIKFRELLNV